MKDGSSAFALRLLVALLSLTAPFAKAADSSPPAAAAEDALGLDSLRGRVVVVDFWASWCVPCRKSFPWMNSLVKAHGDDGLVVLAVNVDKKREAADAFLAEHPAEFRVVYDPEGRFAESYGLKAMPSSFVYDRSGNLRTSHLGFQEKDAGDLEKTIADLLAEEKEAENDEP